jgi:hypothetical protein
MSQEPRIAHARRRFALVLAALVALSVFPASAWSASSGTTTTPGVVSPSLATSGSGTATSTTSGSGPVTVPAPTSSSSSGGLSRTDEIGIILVALLLIGGIWRIIISDARRHNPTGAVPDYDRPRGSVRPIEHRIKDSRAKAKNARRARRARR